MIGFVSEFVPRIYYELTTSSDRSLNGFLNSTLSCFDVNDFSADTKPDHPFNFKNGSCGFGKQTCRYNIFDLQKEHHTFASHPDLYKPLFPNPLMVGLFVKQNITIGTSAGTIESPLLQGDCSFRYRGYYEPPYKWGLNGTIVKNENAYNFSPAHWHIIAGKLFFVIAFEVTSPLQKNSSFQSI